MNSQIRVTCTSLIHVLIFMIKVVGDLYVCPRIPAEDPFFFIQFQKLNVKGTLR